MKTKPPTPKTMNARTYAMLGELAKRVDEALASRAHLAKGLDALDDRYNGLAGSHDALMKRVEAMENAELERIRLGYIGRAFRRVREWWKGVREAGESPIPNAAKDLWKAISKSDAAKGTADLTDTIIAHDERVIPDGWAAVYAHAATFNPDALFNPDAFQTKANTQQTILAGLPGASWCQPEKRAKSLELIAEMKPKTVLELGTFGGGWILPMALAAPQTRFYAVDPYSASACLEGMTTPVSVKWWGNQRMLEDVRHSFWGAVKALGLNNVDLLGITSEQAAGRFADESLCVLHSDANHSLIPTMRDALLWLPKLRIGGVFIQDDIRWHETKGGVATYTVKPTVDFLLANGCELICEVAESVFLRRVK